MSFIEDNNLAKHINEPTRITETKRSELDQIISNCDNMIYNISVTTPVSYNDHHTVSGIIKFKIRRAKAYQRLVWQYGLSNFDYFRYKLNIIDWDSCFDSRDVDLVAEKWTDMLINVALECIPNKMVTIRPWDKPFYNGYLRRLRRAKDRAHRLAKYDNTPEAWDIFRDHRRQYFSEIKRLKLETHNKLLASMGESLISNPRKWWSLSKKLLCKQSSSIPAIIIDGNTISADEEKAQAFNEYFIQCSTLDESNATLPSIHPLIEKDLNELSQWAKTWLVKFSPPKTESLIISNKTHLEEHPPLSMEGSVLKEVTHHKHVGIILTKDLSWHKHICSIEEKAKSRINRLSQFKYRLDRRSLERVYISNIRPIMEYGDVIWAGGNIGDLDKLDMQKNAARVVTGATARCDTSTLMNDVAWPMLASRRRIHRLTMFYQIVNGLSPPYLRDLLPARVGERSRYNMRTGQNFTVPLCRTNTYLKSFFPYTMTEWNRLENSVTNAPTLSSFKSRCKPNPTYKNNLFYYGPRFENVQLARMRIGCSSLKSQLCHNLHVEDNPSCNFIMNKDENYLVLDQEPTTTNIILNGNSDTTVDENIRNMDAIYQYIRDSGRFSYRF